MTAVDIVITACNNISELRDVLNSVKKQTFKDFNCIVVNDHNESGTAKSAIDNFPKITFIGNNGWNGPAKNRNIGINHSTNSNPHHSNLIVTLDDDIILGPTWLEEMVKVMEDKEIGQASAAYPFVGTFYHKPYCCTAASIIRREAFDDVGGFDEDYFYALEDTDFSLRLVAKGWKIKPQCPSHSVHKGSETVFNKLDSSFRLKHFWKNYIMTAVKHELCALPLIACRLVLVEIKAILLWQHPSAIPKAIGWNILNLKNNLEKRRIINDV